MRNLNDLNDLCNVQDVILLCEIFENCAKIMHQMYGFNPRRYNSASSLSGCITRNKSKVIIVLPTNGYIVELFEKTLIGGFSCVNARVACLMKVPRCERELT